MASRVKFMSMLKIVPIICGQILSKMFQGVVLVQAAVTERWL